MLRLNVFRLVKVLRLLASFDQINGPKYLTECFQKCTVSNRGKSKSFSCSFIVPKSVLCFCFNGTSQRQISNTGGLIFLGTDGPILSKGTDCPILLGTDGPGHKEKKANTT